MAISDYIKKCSGQKRSYLSTQSRAHNSKAERGKSRS
jgi:hypothetical protein